MTQVRALPIALSFFCLAAFPIEVFAQMRASTPVKDISPGAFALTLLLVLLGCLAVIVASVRKQRKTQSDASSQEAPLTIVSRLPISQRDEVVVVQDDERWLVLSTGPNGVRTLYTFETPPKELATQAQRASRATHTHDHRP